MDRRFRAVPMPFVPSIQISRNTTAYGPAAALCKNASPLSYRSQMTGSPTPAAAAVPAAGLQTSGLQRSRSAAPSLRSPLQLDCTTFFRPLHLPFTRETPPFTQNCPICAAKACRKAPNPSSLPASRRLLHNLYFFIPFMKCSAMATKSGWWLMRMLHSTAQNASSTITARK